MSRHRDTQLYRAAWRWHFYAALVVIPFLLTLAVTGLVMVYYSAVATPEGPLLQVTPARQVHAPATLLATARAAVNNAQAVQYVPPASPAATARVVFDSPAGALVADIDPWRNRLLRVVNRDQTPYAWAHRIHGTLLLGDVGDFIVETVAGLTLLMVVTGLYMWWLRRGRTPQTIQAVRGRKRQRWRGLHRGIGLYSALALGFFILSGLAWTNIWGGKLVQAWGSFPAEKWGPVALSGNQHGAMNHGSQREVPWGLEQTPLPASGRHLEHGAHRGAPLGLDAIDRRARELGFGPRYRITLPRDSEGVYTIAATTMSGDITRPSRERTVHLDQYSGELVAEAGFADYSWLAKSMAVGVGVHQGNLGPWNALFNAAACLVVIFLCVSGALMWWLRRPARSAGLLAPPRPKALPSRNSLALMLLGCALLFPLLGLALLLGLVLDWLWLRRAPAAARV